MICLEATTVQTVDRLRKLPRINQILLIHITE